jgi:hypothetical protein
MVAAFVAAPTPAMAQAGGAGLRAGVSADPDQFFFGAHVDTGLLVERISFRPNLEVGLGDDITTLAGNFDFVFWIPSRRAWSLYAGAGPALNVYRWDAPRWDDDDETTIEPGFNVLVGLAHRGGLFTEFRVGLIDSPEIKFGIGYSWR